MTKDIIETLVELTNSTEEEINEILDELSINDHYDLIELSNQNNNAELLKKFNSYTKVEEHMSNKLTVGGTIPKPRDPMAKALALPQYQPKSTPSKKGTIEKNERKHKNRTDSETPLESIDESAMGITAVPSIQRMLELAGRDVASNDISKAMEDMFNIPTDRLPDFGKFGIDTTPTGTLLHPGLVNLDITHDELDIDPMDDIQFDSDVFDGPEQSNKSIALVAIQSALSEITSLMSEVKVSEVAAVKELINQLTSEIDQLRNSVSK